MTLFGFIPPEPLLAHAQRPPRQRVRSYAPLGSYPSLQSQIYAPWKAFTLPAFHAQSGDSDAGRCGPLRLGPDVTVKENKAISKAAVSNNW